MNRILRTSAAVSMAVLVAACAAEGDAMPDADSTPLEGELVTDYSGERTARVVWSDFTTTDGLVLAYARMGDHGSPVILIHGSGGQSQTWLEDGVAHELAKNHVVIAADMRGHGRSEGPRDGDMALDVIELMDHLGIQRAHVHGFSMGGSITSRLMARVPERIITAAFGGSGVRESEDGDFADLVPEDAEGEDPFNARATHIYRERRAAVADRLAGTDTGAQTATARREAEGWTPPERPGPQARPLDLTTIDFPVLAIVGEYDGFYDRTHRLWRELHNFQSIKLPQRGHLSSYYPGTIHDAYLHGIVTFIDSHDDPTATIGS